MTLPAAIAALGVAAALAACGGGGDEPATESESAEPPARAEQQREAAHRPAKLPGSWSAERNRRAGLTFGVPRGWTVDNRGRATLVRSFDRLVAISLAADRSGEGLGLGPAEFARQTAAALRGFRGELRLRRARPFAHPRYEGAEVRAIATARDGVRQRVAVIALRRRDLVTVSAVIAANERRVTKADQRLARRVVRTVRTRPPRDQRSGRSG